MGTLLRLISPAGLRNRGGLFNRFPLLGIQGKHKYKNPPNKAMFQLRSRGSNEPDGSDTSREDTKALIEME